MAEGNPSLVEEKSAEEGGKVSASVVADAQSTDVLKEALNLTQHSEEKGAVDKREQTGDASTEKNESSEHDPVSSQVPAAAETTPSSKASLKKSSALRSSSLVHSRVGTALASCRSHLWEVRPTGVLGAAFDPVRDYLLDPMLAVASVALPPLAAALPGGDVAMSSLLLIFFFPLRWAVPALSSPLPEPSSVDMRERARNDIQRVAKAGPPPRFRPPSGLRSEFRSSVAFVCSVVADVVSAVKDPEKMKQWFQAVTEFRAYLNVSGVGAELEESMMKPMLRGRLIDNMKILNDIQERDDADRHERTRKERPNYDEELANHVKDGQRLMRYATAAYGTEMILSAIDREAQPEELDNQQKAIAFHTNIKKEDVKFVYVKDGGDMTVLRHFVAVDHAKKEVVLALRGTLSVSGALVDMQAMDCDFCSGRAHKGMAEMANSLWAASGEIIKDIVEDDEHKDYTFIITGHSLGAGVACLLNVKCHVEKLFGERRILCFGFAPPPTYCFNEQGMDSTFTAAVGKAVENTVCYIHDNDCVPHLSVGAIRRLASLMDAVDNITEHMWFIRRWKIFWEVTDIPREIFEAVAQAGGEGLRSCVVGESKVIIPAHSVVWMKKHLSGPKAGSFEGFSCCPHKISEVNIFVSQDMVNDHMPEQYEDALDALLGIKGA